jgi:hypothetical protein
MIEQEASERILHFVSGFETSQDANGFVHARLADEDRLKAPCKGRIFLYLAIFVQGSTARQL